MKEEASKLTSDMSKHGRTEGHTVSIETNNTPRQHQTSDKSTDTDTNHFVAQ